MEEIVFTQTEEQRKKIKELLEYENPAPRNREERRKQKRNKKRRTKWKKI